MNTILVGIQNGIIVAGSVYTVERRKEFAEDVIEFIEAGHEVHFVQAETVTIGAKWMKEELNKQDIKTAVDVEKKHIIALLTDAWHKETRNNWNIKSNYNLPKWVREVFGIPKVKP